MRRMFLLGAAVLIICLGASVSAASAQTTAPGDPAAYTALSQQSQSVAPTVSWSKERSGPAARGDAEGAGKASDRQIFSRGVGSALRTVVLLSFASIVIGLGAVGLKALWVFDEAEYVALSREPRDNPVSGDGRILTCLGDNPT
jgi:hypothetical protein